MGARSRYQGAEGERAVVAYLRANGYPDARRYLAGDGRQPGDIDFHPLICLEVKNVRSGSAWPTWCRQAVAACRPGLVPVVVRRTDTYANVGAWECRYAYGDWIVTTGDHALGGNLAGQVADRVWLAATFADLVAAVRKLDQPQKATA